MPLPPSFLFSVRYQRAKISGGGGGDDGNNADSGGEGVAREGRCNKVFNLPVLGQQSCLKFVKLSQSPAKKGFPGREKFLLAWRCPGSPWQNLGRGKGTENGTIRTYFN